MTVTIEANRTRSTGLRVDAVSDFFRHRGPIWADGEEVYDFFRRFGVLGNSLVGWFDQTAMQAEDLQSWRNLVAGRGVLDQPVAGKQPSIILPFGNKTTRVFDGIADYIPQKVLADETGATAFYFVTVNGSAAVRVAGVDLTDYIGKFVVFTDSSGKTCSGYIKAADTAEAFGADLLFGWDFTDGWSAGPGGDPAVIDDANSFTSPGIGYVYKGGVVNIRKLYKIVTAGSTTSSVMQAKSGSLVVIYLADFGTAYFNAPDAYALLYVPDAGTSDITTYTIQEVTHLGTDAVLITSTPGGSQNWNIDAGFNPNDSSMTFEIFEPDFNHVAAFSQSWWIYPTDPTNFVICDKLDATAFQGYRIGCDAADKPYCSIGDGTDIVTATWGDAISANTWYKITAGHDGTKAFVSVGVGARVTAAQDVPADTHTTFKMGYDGTNFADGRVASFIDFSRGLTPAEAEVIARVFAISGRN